jgi:hypothetical protein
VVNAGWTRGVGVPRCNPNTNEPEFFETFGPKAIGLKGLDVPDTTLSRSIILDMQRKLPEDKAEEFAHTDDEELAILRRKLARFAEDNLDKLGKPKMPEGFANRLAANWRMLFAIAEICGRGDEARTAATFLSRRSDEASLGVELLRDIREIFARSNADRMKSKDLVHELASMEDRPWFEMPYSGRAITQVQVAKLLKPFKVRPNSVKFGETTFKGYTLEWFEKAFRYIPERVGAQSPESSRNPGTMADFCEKSRNQTSPQVPGKMADFCESSGVPPGSGELRADDPSDPVDLGNIPEGCDRR